MRISPRGPLAIAFTLTLALTLLATSCGSGSANPAPVPMDGYVQALINRNCARAVACGQTPDLGTCLASTSIDLGQVFAAVSAGKTTYDGAAAARCLASISLDPASCTVTVQRASSDPSCAQIFNGTLADGATCSEAGDCLSAACQMTACSGTPACCTGTCGPAAPAPLPIGGDCVADGASCVAGAHCQPTTSVCAADIALGQPCDVVNGDQCAPGLFCAQGAAPTTLVCVAPPADGETCSSSVPCDALGDFCDPTTLECVPKIAVGGACPSGGVCVDYAQCDFATSICVAAGTVGASCGASDANCLSSLVCTTDAVCALPAPAPICP